MSSWNCNPGNILDLPLSVNLHPRWKFGAGRSQARPFRGATSGDRDSAEGAEQGIPLKSIVLRFCISSRIQKIMLL